MKPSMYSMEISGPSPAEGQAVTEATRPGWLRARSRLIGLAQGVADQVRLVDAQRGQEVAHRPSQGAHVAPPTSLVEPPWPGRSSA